MLAKKSTRGRFFAIVTYRFFNYDQQYTSQYLYYNVGLYVLIYTYHIILWTSSKVHQKAPSLSRMMYILLIYTWDLM